MAKKFTIDDDVRDVLSEATIDATSVKLNGKLDPKLYARVDKVLTAAGGKWNRKAGAHIFTSDPRKILGLTIKTGIATNVQQETQFFPSPMAVVDKVISLAMLRDGMTVLEPSAGIGNLAIAARGIVGRKRVECVEKNDDMADRLMALGFATEHMDFLKKKPPRVGTIKDDKGERHVDDRFDRVIMNPPFDRGADIKHIKHALKFLKPGGRLVAVLAAGERQRKWFLHMRHAGHWVSLPDDSFKKSGTGVKTAIVVIDKSKKE